MSFIETLGHKLSAPIDTESGRLTNIPNFVIGFSVFMSINAILQAIADIVIEFAIIAGWVGFKIPFRLEFLFLTLISAVIAYLTLRGMREGDLDVTKNTLTLGLIVESSLVIGDIVLLATIDTGFWSTFAVRLPFMILTTMNIFIISYILTRRYIVRIRRPNYRF